MTNEENGLVEETARAMRQLARTVTDAPPLRLAPQPGARPPRHSRRSWTLWAVPLAAALAVIALAITLVTIRDIPGERTATPAGSAAASVPRYYVWLPGADDLGRPPGSAEAVVSDTFTGQQVAVLRPKAGYLFFSVVATADDRTFILGEGQHAQPAVWYRLQIATGSAVSTRLAKLPIPAQPPDSLVVAPAISPDGRKLAVLDIHSSTRTGETMRIYSVATGAVLHTWSSPGALGDYGATTLSWAAGQRRLAIGAGVSMWMLDVTRPGHNLIADSKLVWSVKPDSVVSDELSPLSCGTDMTTLATPDGKSVVCAAYGVFHPTNPAGTDGCPAIPPWNTIGFLEYSTTTGKLARTLYKINTACEFGGAAALWTNASGSVVIGYFASAGSGIRFGVFSAHGFTPLPLPLTTKTSGTPGIAW